MSLWPKCLWPKCHSGQSVTLAKVSPAKVSLAKVSLWPKCQQPKCHQPKCLWPKYQQPKCLWPNCLWPKCLCGPNVPAKVSAAKVSFRPKCEPANIHTLGPFSRCFSCKTAFLKWIFEADPVGVQIRTVSHFNGLEETFKMR